MQPNAAYSVATSQATSVATPQNWAQVSPTTVNKLGDRIDGWADTVVQHGNLAGQIAQTFSQELLPHLKPEMQPTNGKIGVGGLSSLAKGNSNPFALNAIGSTIGRSIAALPKVPAVFFGRSPADRQHQYQYVTVAPGVSLIVKISAIGYDLFVSWDLFAKRVWNEVVIGWIILTAVIFTLLQQVVATLIINAINSATASSGYPATTTAVGFSPITFIIGLVVGFLGWLVGIALFVAVLSFLFRRNPLAFFVKDADLFELHDVEGLVLSVHKALYRSIEAAGIDTSTLRKKDAFKSNTSSSGF